MIEQMVIGEHPNDEWTINFGEFNHETDVVIPKRFATNLLKIKEEFSRLKAEIERLLKDTGERVQTISKLSVRLSEALGALKPFVRELDMNTESTGESHEESDLWDNTLSKSIFVTAHKVLNSTDNARLLERDRARGDVIHWAQAVLTALNVGDVKKDSLLHEKLREIMIAYREALESHEKEGGV